MAVRRYRLSLVITADACLDEGSVLDPRGLVATLERKMRRQMEEYILDEILAGSYCTDLDLEPFVAKASFVRVEDLKQ